MSDSKHIMMTVGLFFAVLLLGGAGLMLPNYREVRAIQAKVDDLRFRSDSMEETTMRVEQLTHLMAHAESTIDSELKIIPARPDVASVIRRLSFTIDRVSVIDQTFNAGVPSELLPESNPSIRMIPVTMEMKGTFESVYSVFRIVESMERLIRVRSVRMRRLEDVTNISDQPVLETALVLEVIYDDSAAGEDL